MLTTKNTSGGRPDDGGGSKDKVKIFLHASSLNILSTIALTCDGDSL